MSLYALTQTSHDHDMIYINWWRCFSLDAWLDEALFEGGVDSSTHGHIGSVTDGGVTLDTLQAGGAAKAHVANPTCRHQTEGYSCWTQGQ